MNQKIGLAVFAKYPEPGRVKTRLAKAVGNDRACEIYVRLLGHFLQHTILPLDRARTNPVLYLDPSTPLETCRRAFAFTNLEIRHQSGADLGERMKNALKELESGAGTIVVGSDCVDVTPEILDTAALALRSHELCLGPTGDGGYYLLGLKKVEDTLFDGIPWSTSQVTALTLERADAMAWRTKLLQPLRDVDEIGDWEAIGWRVDEDNEAIRSLRLKKT